MGPFRVLDGALLLLLCAHAVADLTVDSHITIQPATRDDKLRVRVELGGSTHELQLHLSEDFVHQDFVIGIVQQDGSVTPQRHQPTRCHYDGVVEGAEGSVAAISVCNGIVEGFFDVAGLRSTIHPVKLSEGAGGSLKATVKQATLLATQARHQKEHVHGGDGKIVTQKLPGMAEPTSAGATDRRKLASCASNAVRTPCCEDSSCGTCDINTETKVVEVSLVTDALWHDKHGSDGERHITVFHKAAVMYAQANFSPKINLQLRSYTPFNESTPSGVVPPAITCNCFDMDCIAGIPSVNDEDYLAQIADFRVALLDAIKGDTTQFLTSYDLAVPNNDAGTVCPGPTGIANMGKICSSKESVGVNEDLPTSTVVFAAETLAHEIGHVLGALHDGATDVAEWYPAGPSSCDPDTHIMASASDPSVELDQFSTCTFDAVNAITATTQVCCLQENTTTASVVTDTPTTASVVTDTPTTASVVTDTPITASPTTTASVVSANTSTPAPTPSSAGTALAPSAAILAPALLAIVLLGSMHVH